MAKFNRLLAFRLLYDMARDNLSPNADTHTIKHVMSFLIGYEIKEDDISELFKLLHVKKRIYKTDNLKFENQNDLKDLEEQRKISKKEKMIDYLIYKTIKFNLSYKHKKHKLNSS